LISSLTQVLAAGGAGQHLKRHEKQREPRHKVGRGAWDQQTLRHLRQLRRFALDLLDDFARGSACYACLRDEISQALKLIARVSGGRDDTDRVADEVVNAVGNLADPATYGTWANRVSDPS
jgi:hypothetical protein